MADPQLASDLLYMLDRFGNKVIWQQGTFKQKLINLMMPADEDYDEPPVEGRLARPISVERGFAGVDIVNVDIGTTTGIGAYDDGGARPAGGGRPASQGTKLPVLIGGTIKFTLAEVELARGQGQAVDKFLATVKAHGAGWGAFMARSVHNPLCSDPTADKAIGDTTMIVSTNNGYIEGQTYEVRLDSDSSLVGEFDAALVAVNFDGTATITFASALTFAITRSTMSIYLKGQGDSTKALGSLADAVNSSLDMYGLSRSTVFPNGITQDVSGAWSNIDGKTAVDVLDAAGCYPTHIVSSPRGISKITTAQNDNVRFIPGMGDAGRDPYADAMVPEFAGLPCIRCPRGDDTTIVFGDFNHVKVREQSPYRPRLPSGGEKGDLARSSLFTSEQIFAQKLLCDGWYSTVFTKRRAFLSFTNVLS